MNIFSYWWDCFKARRRGERRTHGRDIKGRVYRKINHMPEGTPGTIPVVGKFKATIQATGFYSAEEDQWYDLDQNGNRTPRRPHRITSRR